MFDNFSQPVSIYCERLSPAFWAEPVNALSNLAFILAAVFAYLLWRKQTAKTMDMLVLIIMALVVGTGSFIFHTVATKGAMLADIIPIIIFIHYALWVIFTRGFGVRWYYAATAVIAFIAFNVLILNAFGRTLFNGSIQYVPTFLMLLLVAIYAVKKRYGFSHEFFIAALTFYIAITCRSIDNIVCPQFPLGTHFLWHIFNGVTMYFVMRGLTIERATTPSPKPL